MRIPDEGYLLRIFVGEADKWQGKPIYECILRCARERHLAGATVVRGFEGFGANSHLRTPKILALSQDLPMIIEIVDARDKVDAFLPEIEEMLQGCLVTLERVQVLRYQPSRSEA